jgi:hypothetical protein
VGRHAPAEPTAKTFAAAGLLRRNKHFFGNGIFSANRPNDVQIIDFYNKDFNSVGNATDDDKYSVHNYLAIA